MNRLGKGPVSPYFERQIQFFMGQGKTLKDQKEIWERNQFCKDVIEGRPARVPADVNEVSREMSQRGRDGKKA